MNKRTFYAFLVSFVLLIAVILLNKRTFREMRNYTDGVDHTREVISYFEKISNHFKSAQIYTPTFLHLPEKEFYLLYKRDADSITGELNNLKNLVKDNPVQIKLVDSLSSMILEQMPVLLQKNVAQIIESGEGWRLKYLLDIHQKINRGIGTETDLLAHRKEDLKESTKQTNILTISFAIIAVAIILFYFVTTVFITRKRLWLEGFLESILNTSQNGIANYKAVRDHGQIVDFKLEFANNAIENLLALNTEPLIGKELKSFPSFIHQSNLFSIYSEVVETGQSKNFETVYKRGNIQKWFMVSLVKLGDGLTASFQDITQLKKYEEELKENITQLERSNTELEQYAYIASHDLQEPLRKIRSFGSYLKETQSHNLDEKGKLHLEKITSSAERMSVLIKDILSFSSIKKEDGFVATDLNKVLETVLEDFDLSISQKQAIVQSDSLPVIEAIPLQMNQLFYNLVSNSLKFSKQDEKLVLIITSTSVSTDKKNELGLEAGINYYELVFSDNGIGFNQEYADQIFGLFKRLNDKRYYPGSGIGLSLCKKVVNNHNGIIFAKSSENNGARFYIYLPETQKNNSDSL